MVQIILMPAADDERIELTFPFDRTILRAVKKLPGSRWDQRRRRWSIPRRTIPCLRNALAGADVRLVERQEASWRKLRVPVPAVPRPRLEPPAAPKSVRARQRSLPAELNSEELRHLLDTLRTVKHRALALLLYSSGARVSEVVRLRTEDVDHDSGMLWLRDGKDRRVRCALLSPVVSRELKRYRRLYRPTDWLFPGAMPHRPLSARTVRKLIGAALERAATKEPVVRHRLRLDLRRIRSPLDALFLDEEA